MIHSTLNDIHQRPFDTDNRHQAKNEDRDLRATGFQGIDQHMSISHVLRHFQDSKHPEHAQNPDDDKVT